MGGPSNIPEVEIFLKNMFSDPNILPVNPLFRKLIGTIIVKKRVHEAQENYKLIGGKSPLLEITEELASKIEQKTKISCYPVMRYVPPFAKSVLEDLQKQGIEELILLPMYPHYSTTTTKSSIDDIKAACLELNFTPKLTRVEEYYNNETFIDIQTNLIIEALENQEPSSKELIISAHGLPLSIIEAGDPYQEHIETNVALLKNKLVEKDIHFQEVTLAYQSKVGNGTWLEPNLSDILRNPKNLDVLIFPIAFTIDNSETIFELDIENREIADKIGYNSYGVTQCPNSSDEFSDFLAHLVQDALVN